jgi:hypothetical protein
MTTPVAGDPGVDPALPPGKIRFVDTWIPALSAGDYTASVTQRVTGGGGLVDATFGASVDFTVAGPRFTLASDDVHAAFPPPSAAGNYHLTLPYVALTRRTLPWERAIGGSAERRDPWLALLVLSDDEIAPLGEKEVATATRAVARSWTEATTSSGSITAARIALSLDEQAADGRCFTIDVTTTAVHDAAPRINELRYFSHVRQVDTGGKEILGLDEDGWFSIIVSCRLPATGRNYVHLVSMEGQTETASPGYQRFVSLASWWFDCQEAQATFGERVRQLKPELLALPHATPASWTGDRGEARAIAQDTLAKGFVPVAYTTRLGEQTTCWYRGPFTPYATEDMSLDGFFSAEAGMIYDERTGMFDMSLAVAWQVGRLLALSDKGFASALLGWRRTGEAGVNLLHERLTLADRFRAHLPEAEDSPSLLAPAFARGIMKRFLGGVFAGTVLGANGKRPVAPRTDPSTTLAHLAQLPGVLAPNAVGAALDAGNDPVDLLRRALANQ